MSPSRWDHIVCPHSTRVPQDQISLPKDLLSGFSLTPGWVRVVPPVARSPFAPTAPDSGPSFCRAAPKSPTIGRRTPLSRSGSFSLQPAPGGGVTPGCEENQERNRKGVSSWSALSSDLGPPSLSLTLPTTRGSPPPHPSPSLHVLL